MNCKFSRSQIKVTSNTSIFSGQTLGQQKLAEGSTNPTAKLQFFSPDINKKKTQAHNPSIQFHMEQKENFQSQHISESLASRILSSPSRVLTSPLAAKYNLQDRALQSQAEGKQNSPSVGVIYKTKAFSKFNIPYNAFGKNTVSSVETSPNLTEAKNAKPFFSPNLETKTTGKYKQHLQQIFSARLNK